MASLMWLKISCTFSLLNALQTNDFARSFDLLRCSNGSEMDIQEGGVLYEEIEIGHYQMEVQISHMYSMEKIFPPTSREYFVHRVRVLKFELSAGRGMTYEPRDPFVRVYVLPDEINFQQSKVRKKTLSPRFNENFFFEMNSEETVDRTLRLSVYDIDKRNVRHSLGHAFIPLAKVDLTSNCVLAKNLELVSQNKAHIGELQFSLCCNPYSERIKVNVMRAKHLVIRGFDTDHSDMYVKVELFFGPKLMKSKETSRQRICESPNFYQNFSFGIAGRHFDSCSISLVVMVHKVPPSPYPSQPGTPCSSRSPAESVPGSDIMYGRVVVGPFMFARGEQLLHWQDMLSNPRTPVERWHSLNAVT